MKTYERLGLPGPQDAAYWEKVEARAKELGTDGCSGPTLQLYVRACWEHDIHYRTGCTLYGRRITRAEADTIFRERHLEASPLGGLSPMAWWRWLALRAFGSRAWRHPW